MREPTDIERHVYRACIERWGEPNEAIMYDARCAVVPPKVERTLVMVWRPTPEQEMTLFATVGMSAMQIPDATYRAELRMLVRGTLANEIERRIAAFLASVANYPFDHARTLDWWHVLSNVGSVPAFDRCSALLLHGAFTEGGWDQSQFGDEVVRFFNLVPITHDERAIAVTAGAPELREHWKARDVDIFMDRARGEQSPSGAPRARARRARARAA
jgi:Suppressor of fused protein (SUFU)